MTFDVVQFGNPNGIIIARGSSMVNFGAPHIHEVINVCNSFFFSKIEICRNPSLVSLFL